MPISKRSLKARNKRIKASRKTTRNRRKTQVCRVFTCKVDYGKLTEKQRNALTELFRDAKRLYNDCVLADSVFDYAIPKSVTVRMPDGSFETVTSTVSEPSRPKASSSRPRTTSEA